MFPGTSCKFSDLAHSARQSTVTDPSTGGQTTRLPAPWPSPTWPGAVLAPPSPSPHSTLCQHGPGPPPPPIPPAVGSGLSGVLEAGVGWGEAPWVWEDDQVHAEQSGPRVWEEKRMEPHTVGKNSCLVISISAHGPAPGPAPDTALSCLEQWPPAGFWRVSPC